jgi:hypothetical protein
MAVDVEGPQMLKFTIPLPLGISSDLADNLTATWKTSIILTYITESNSNFVSRLLQSSGTRLTISNALISTNSIVLYCDSLPAYVVVNANSFQVTFNNNLFSPGNIMYSISTSNMITNVPWVIR